LVKYNLQTNQAIYWSQAHVFCGEPTFVANPAGTFQDDGVIISMVYNVKNRKSFLLILDAYTMKELARINLPHPLPNRLHVKFVMAENSKT